MSRENVSFDGVPNTSETIGIGYIYVITNTSNGKIYIGQTTKSISARFQQHISNSNTRHAALYKAMRKYGIESFIVDKIEEVMVDRLDEREEYWIWFHDSTNRGVGYNMTLGGSGASYRLLTDEEKSIRNEKISSKLKGRKQSPELIEKRTKKLKGRKISDETRRRISIGQLKRSKTSYRRGYLLSEEVKLRISRTLTGRVQSVETKKKRSDTMSKLRWFNNGIESKRCIDCPEGWVPGRLKVNHSKEGIRNSSHRGMHVFNNGITNITSSTCPEGFVPGRINSLKMDRRKKKR